MWRNEKAKPFPNTRIKSQPKYPTKRTWLSKSLWKPRSFPPWCILPAESSAAKGVLSLPFLHKNHAGVWGREPLRSSKLCHLQEKTQKLHGRGHAGGNVGRQASALSPVWRSVVRHITQPLHRRRVMHTARKDPHKTNWDKTPWCMGINRGGETAFHKDLLGALPWWSRG